MPSVQGFYYSLNFAAADWLELVNKGLSLADKTSVKGMTITVMVRLIKTSILSCIMNRKTTIKVGIKSKCHQQSFHLSNPIHSEKNKGETLGLLEGPTFYELKKS